MSNIKIGTKTYTNVNKVKFINADDPLQFVNFSVYGNAIGSLTGNLDTSTIPVLDEVPVTPPPTINSPSVIIVKGEYYILKETN